MSRDSFVDILNRKCVPLRNRFGSVFFNWRKIKNNASEKKFFFERGPDEGIDKMIYSFESLNHFNVFDTSNAINRTSIKTRS